jgi:hypothetical protein
MPGMAAGACIGAPTLNLLLGCGSATLLGNLLVASPYPFELNLQLYVSLLFLVFILVAMLVYAFANNFEVCMYVGTLRIFVSCLWHVTIGHTPTYIHHLYTIHTYIHTSFIHTYVHTHTHTHTYTPKHIHTHTHIHTYTPKHIHQYIPSPFLILCVCMSVCI